MNKARQKFSKIILMTVSAVGLCSTVLLMSDPPAKDLNVAHENIFSLNTEALMANRSVASQDKETLKRVTDNLFHLNCADTNQVLETVSTRFRLRGEHCLPDPEGQALSTQIRNKSNGYVATVFRRTPLQFTTDYINLNEGKNEIDIKFQTDKGLVEKSLTVVRRPSSTKK